MENIWVVKLTRYWVNLNWLSISSQFHTNILQLLEIQGQILVPPVTQLFRSKWLYFFLSVRTKYLSCSFSMLSHAAHFPFKGAFVPVMLNIIPFIFELFLLSKYSTPPLVLDVAVVDVGATRLCNNPKTLIRVSSFCTPLQWLHNGGRRYKCLNKIGVSVVKSEVIYIFW